MKSVVLCEKPSQAKNVQAAVGSRFGRVIGLRGHIIRLATPEEVNPEWQQWSCDLLRPASGFYPFSEDTAAGKDKLLREVRTALADADRVIIATDCDREGQAIGENLIRYLKFKGQVLRAMFNAEDVQSLQEAFENLSPNPDHLRLYQAAVARAQVDQIANLSATRAATVVLKPTGMRGAMGVGRVRTPTMGIVCKRQIEIDSFRPRAYWDLWLEVEHNNEPLRLKHRPSEETRLYDRAEAEALVSQMRLWNGPLSVVKEEKRQSPPKLNDLPALQIYAARWGWSAKKTLDVAQALYETHKITTYPRAESTFLPEVEIENVDAVISALNGLEFAPVYYPEPIIRRGKSGHFSDKALEGSSHHAIIPNIKTAEEWDVIYTRLSADERKLFEHIARTYLCAVGPDRIYDRTEISLVVQKRKFSAVGVSEKDPGWREVLGANAVESEEDGEELPPVPTWSDGAQAQALEAGLEAKTTKPPAHYTEGSLIKAMKDAWRFASTPEMVSRLKEAKGIGTPATRDGVIAGLIKQGYFSVTKGRLHASPLALEFYKELMRECPEWLDPAATAEMEMALDAILRGEADPRRVIDDILVKTQRFLDSMKQRAGGAGALDVDVKQPPSARMLAAAKSKAKRDGVSLPRGASTDARICREFLGPMPEGNAPTEGQLTFAGKIADAMGIVLTDELRGDRKKLSAWIDQNKTNMPKERGDDQPTPKQVELAERIATEKSIEIPPETLRSKSSLSKWLDTHAAKRSGRKKQG
ncbi:DNA topoisomerase [uncultured Tateyamaria sp.]|uniref:DNA topoisomerase n=1 Tax=uncultured Tateyamaria sp. TaxID=455651 RepID=UPI002622A273|nr:DNA topoisomerase [uncultured Tateyamaria sp.]